MATNQQATGHTDASLYDYDVFLSFRGADVRASFMDVLYHHMDKAGLRVFVDDVELQLGDNLGKILLAIDNSRLCIPIFSQRFAESRWCLMEVARMVKMQKQILPIFYDVKIEDVNLETSTYKEFMGKHVEKYEKHEVEEWREALQTIAALDRKELMKTGYTAFCESLVKELLIRLEYRRIFGIDHLIGMDDQVQRAKQLLDIDPSAVRYIGIYGMGGIGKTTLAKDIYNKIKDKFERSSFLEDIRESFRRGGTTCLLEKLLNSLDITTFGREPEHFPRLMKECFRRKKILIVLDDVHEWEQIADLAGKSSWFGLGSRIIIVSRNNSVMKRGDGKPSEDEVRDFEMEPLGRDNALKLFNRHAFKDGSPTTTTFEDLSKEAASLTGGLPLALKVIGSLLYNKRSEVWEEIIKKLTEIPESDVNKRLKISYDALSDEQKHIYLDIACYFVGSSITYPIYMWRACKFCPNSGLEILSSLSLVKVSDGGIISMHDLLRDLGRDIVREEDIKIPRNRSRLWEDVLARKVLMSNKEKKNVEALRIEGDIAIDLTQQQVKIGSLENLRYLDLQRTTLQGHFEDIFPDLLWLSYHCHDYLQGATTFAMTKLVILDLSRSTINENWCGWSQLEDAKNLKVLDLSEAEHLTSTPYFPEGMTLERLILDGCSKLVAIDVSVRHLKCLKFLSLIRCYSLTGLPYEVGDLECLEYMIGDHFRVSPPERFKNLNLPECSSIMGIYEEGSLSKSRACGSFKIFSLPVTFGNLVNLKLLSLAHVLIRELPESFGEELKSLIYLDLEGTFISNLPESIKGMEKLKNLSLWGCKKLINLPPTLGELKSLETLDLTDTRLVELPPSVGELTRLKRLLLLHCIEMKKLPDSLRTLTSLVELDLGACGFLELPEWIGGLENLEKLSMEGCSIIKTLPSSIGDLKRVVSLNLSMTGITELPESIGGLENLREINLRQCPLKTLPESFGSLKKLEKLDAAYADLSGGLPSELSGLSSLKFMNLSHTRVRDVPSSINQLHHLHELCLEDNQLQEMPDLPTNLMELFVTSESLHTLSLLSKLQSLTRLSLALKQQSFDSDFGICKLSQLVELTLYLPAITTLPDEFGNLTRLKKLLLGGQSLRSVPRLPLGLERIYLLAAGQGPDLPNLQDLKNLYFLEVRNMSSISLLHLSLPVSLRELHVIYSSDLESWPDISHLKNLRTLHVVECRNLTEIPGLEKLESLEYLVLEHCHSLTKFKNLSQLKQMKFVRIESCGKLDYPEGIDRSKVIIGSGDFQEMSEATTSEGHDIYSLLSSPGSDYLIRGNDNVVKVDCLKGKKVCLYFYRSFWATFTTLLFDTCRDLNGSKGEWMVVCVPCDPYDDDYLHTFLSQTNWLAVQFSDEDKRRRLKMQFQKPDNEGPGVCIFNEHGQLLSTEGFEIIGSYGVDGYPFTHERIQYLKSIDEVIRTNQSIEVLFSDPWTEFDPSSYTTSFTDMFYRMLEFTKTHGKIHNLVDINDFNQRNQSSASNFFVCLINYVLTLDGNQRPVSELEGKIVGIYFSSSSYLESTGFTHLLQDVYKELKASGKSFEIVWAPIEHHTHELYNIFKTLSNFTLPIWVRLCFRLYFYFRVKVRPTLLIIGQDGKILQPNVAEAIQEYGAQAYPFTPKTIENARKARLVVSKCRESVVTNRGERVGAFTLAGKNILLYFAAHWSSDCCAFLPMLKEAYDEIKEKDDAFEVIYLSNDEDEASFREGFSAMLWPALPFGDERIHALYSVLEVTEIPTLVAIGSTGRIITKGVLELIIAYGSDAYPFTNNHINNVMVKNWPRELQHSIHPHELALAKTQAKCGACNYHHGMHVWSYCCMRCNFNLHRKCALKAYTSTAQNIQKAREEPERLMVSKCRESVVTNKGERVVVSTLASKNILLYFSTSDNFSCGAFLPKLLEAYAEIKGRDDAFEVIFISVDRDGASFRKSFSAMPWLALPFGDVRIPLLYGVLKVTRVPTLVAVGPTDRIITKDVKDFILAYGSVAYPFTNEHMSNTMVRKWPHRLHTAHLHAHELILTMRLYTCEACYYQQGMHLWSYCCMRCNFDIHPSCAFKAYPLPPKDIEKARKEEERERFVVSACRESLITSTGEYVGASTLAGKNILLYFSRWTPRCCAFLPMLKEAYKEIRARDDTFEVVFTSFDKDEASFCMCFSTVPWLALPFGDERIPTLYGVLNISFLPTLVAIGPTDQIIGKDVYDLIVAYGSYAYPFTFEHLINMVKSWPHKLQHPLHGHDLTLTEKVYRCDACTYPQCMLLWSYSCISCNFNLHPKCALQGSRRESPEELGTRLETMARDTLENIIDSIRISTCRQFPIASGEHQVHVSDLLGENILLFFSANRISHASDLLPKLIKSYHEIKARDDAFEVIFIPVNEIEASFHQYFSTMPWRALSFRDERIPLLVLLLEVMELPKLVAIGRTNRIITKEAIKFIDAFGSDAYPFTDEHIAHKAKEWPRKLSHALHDHELALTRGDYVCRGCDLHGCVWSYSCEECGFNLHPNCAFEGGRWESPEQSEPCALLRGECSQSSSGMCSKEGK